MRRNRFGINFKDENQWKSEQEVVIARRKTRGSIFLLRILFVIYALFICYVIALYDSPQIKNNLFIIIVIITAWLVIMLFMLIRIKYLSYKYKD